MNDKPESLRVVICESLLEETKAVLESGNFADVAISTYPIACGIPRPRAIWSSQVSESYSSLGDTLLIGGSCVPPETGKSENAPENCRVFCVDQCAYLFSDKKIVDDLTKGGSYVVTPGWLLRWRSILDLWGFTQSTAREFFAESLKNIALLDTGIDEKSGTLLEEFCEYVGLPGKQVDIGLDHYRLLIEKLILEWRLEKTRKDLRNSLDKANRKKANQAMLFDLMSTLTHMKTEVEAADQIIFLFDMLLAPRNVLFATVRDNLAMSCHSLNQPMPEIQECQSWIDLKRAEGQIPGQENSYFFRLSINDELVGLLEIDEVSFSDYQGEYSFFISLVARVCGLAISNARMYQDLEKLATTDPLTGLYNRRRFFELATAEFSRARRYGHDIAAIMLDIDFFKLVNDTHGHLAGDKVLAEIAHRLAAIVRASDICGRYGGEEFVVLLPETSLEIAMKAAERIRMEIEALIVEYEDKVISVTLSIGLSFLTPDCANLESLINQSDKALYVAKQAGRNRVCVWKGESEKT